MCDIFLELSKLAVHRAVHVLEILLWAINDGSIYSDNIHDYMCPSVYLRMDTTRTGYSVHVLSRYSTPCGIYILTIPQQLLIVNILE